MESDEARIHWVTTPDQSISVMLDNNYRVAVVAPSLVTPHYSEGDWTWVLLDDPDIEWGKECSREEAMIVATEAYVNLLDSFGDWLPENTVAFRPLVEE